MSNEPEPTPDEYCPHVQSGIAEMTGGWYFAAHVPPKAVGMCHECIEWCRKNFESAQTWNNWVTKQREQDDQILGTEFLC